MHLVIADSAAHVGVSGGRIQIRSEANGDTEIPIELVEAVTLFGRPSLTTPFIIEMMNRNVDVLLFTIEGRYRGRIAASDTTYAPRLRAQVQASDNPTFSLAIAKQLVRTKLEQQRALVTAFDQVGSAVALLGPLEHSLEWMGQSGTIAEVNGFEGNGAKAYFAALAELVPQPFAFSGRSTRPPRDAFNAMISYGYSLLHRHMVGAIERANLNPYLGFMHQDARGHATLASDLIEVWRAPIVDDLVLRLILDGGIMADQFTADETTGGVSLERQAMAQLTKAFGQRITRIAPYLEEDSRRYTFQYALELQLQSLVRAIETRNPDEFVAIHTQS